MANPPGSGTDIETLKLGVDTSEAVTAASDLDKLGAVTIKTVDSIGTLERASVKASEVMAKGNQTTRDRIAALNAQWEAEQANVQAAKEILAINEAIADQGTRYIAKLEEMVATYNMSTGALQRYRAEQLGVAAEAEPLIIAMERMAAATKQYGVVITEVGQIEAARVKWEEANMTALNAQRTRSLTENTAAEESAMTSLNAQRARALADQAKLEASALTSLNAQRIRALEEQAILEESARTSLNAQRIRSIRENQIAEVAALKEAAAEKLRILEQENSAEIALNAQRSRAKREQIELETSAMISLNAQRIRETTEQAAAEESAITALNAQRIRSKAENAKEAAAIAEREAIEEVKWQQMSVKSRIAELERLKAYQANSAISSGTISSMFGPQALRDLPQLDALIKQYSDSLGSHGKRLGEASEATNVFSRALDNNRVRTEAIVIAHEAMQGRFTRIPGSIMVMGEYLNAASVNFTGMGLSVLGVVAGLALLSYEMIRGQNQQYEFGSAIARTNDYAGATRSGLESLAQSVGKLHGQYSEAYEAAARLTMSGKFTAEQIAGITASVVALEHAFGTQLNVSIKEFESLSVRGTTSAYGGSLNVSKALEKLDEQYHFVNASLMQEVINLEQEGKMREASALAVKAYTDETQRASDEARSNIGWIQQAWEGVTKAVHTATQAMADLGKRNTASQLVAKAQTSVDVLSTYADGSRIDITDPNQVNKIMGLAQALRTLDMAKMALAVEDQKASDRADWTNKQSDATHALTMRAIEDKRLMKKSQSELDAALERNKTENDTIELAQPGYKEKNAEYLAKREAAIIKAHTESKRKILDDGRKLILQDEMAGAQVEYDRVKEETNATEKLLKEWADNGQITRQTEYNSIAAAYKNELEALDAKKRVELDTLNKYAPLNDKDAIRTINNINKVTREYELAGQKIRNAQELSQQKVVDVAVKAATKDDTNELKDLEDKIGKQKLLNDQYGKTADLKILAKKNQEEEKNAQDELEVLLLDIKLKTEDLGEVEQATTAAHLDRLKQIIANRKEYNALLAEGARLEAQAAIDKKFTDLSRKFGDDLGQAIFDGGTNGFKRLIRDMSIAFARTILRPILQPITDGMAGFFYPGASAAGGVGGADGTSGGSSAIGTANALAQGYKALSGGFAGISSSIGAGISGFGNFVGSSSISAFGSGMGMTGAQASAASQAYGAAGMSGTGSAITAGSYAGSAAQIAAGIYAGIKLGASISGEYGSRGTVNSGTAIGTVVGAYVAGPIGAAIGAALGGTIGGFLNRAFGMGDKNVTSQGMSGTLSSSGVTGSNYSNWHQDGGWFRSDKNGTETSALSTDVVNSFTSGLSTMKLTSIDFAKSLGITSNVLDGYSKNFDIKLTSDAAANQKAITDFFVTIGDEMATRLVPNLSQFAKSGEIASVTLQRLSEDFKATDTIAMSLGFTSQAMFRGTGLETAAARDRVLTASGGSSNALSQAATYASNFLTEAQRLAPALSAVNTAMQSLGYYGVDTREKFAALISGLISSGAILTDAGAKQYASVMSLADAFATTHAASEDLSKSVQQIADEMKTLRDQYDKLTLSSAALRAKERLSIDASNRALYDQVQARTDLSDAYSRESNALKQTIADNKAFSASLLTFKDSLNMGSLSGFTPVQALAEAKQQYESTLSKAKTGDKDAQNNLTNAAQAYLTADQLVKASSGDYMNDKNRVLSDMQQLADLMTNGQTDAELQLAAMDKSVSQLININEGVKSVAQILSEISKLPVPNSGTNAPLPSSTNPNTIVSSPTSGSVAAAIAPLVGQIESLQAALVTQTNAMIVSNAVVTNESANVVAQGSVSAVKYSNWKLAQMQESWIEK